MRNSAVQVRFMYLREREKSETLDPAGRAELQAHRACRLSRRTYVVSVTALLVVTAAGLASPANSPIAGVLTLAASTICLVLLPVAYFSWRFARKHRLTIDEAMAPSRILPDRYELRRAYLRAKANAYAESGIYSFLAILCFCLAVILAFGVVLSLGPVLHGDHNAREVLLVSGAILAPVISIFWSSRKQAVATRKVAANLPHVPPVNISVLPSEEILVRSAAAPEVQSENLLKAAPPGDGSTPEELLRGATEFKDSDSA